MDPVAMFPCVALGVGAVLCGCLGAAFGARYGWLWFAGFAWGVIFGPLGVLFVYLRSGRNCWHCWSRIHYQARTCPHCHGDVVDRRKGKASRTGFGARTRQSGLRKPGDAPPA